MQKRFIINLFLLLNIITLPIYTKKQLKQTVFARIIATKNSKELKTLLKKLSTKSLNKNYRLLQNEHCKVKRAIEKACEVQRKNMEQLCQKLPSEKEKQAYEKLKQKRKHILQALKLMKKTGKITPKSHLTTYVRSKTIAA